MLKGLRIIEVGSFLSAPFATALMAELGADVTKIEPATGDPLRTFGPSIDPQLRLSGLFVSLNHAKKLVTLDLRSMVGKTAFLDLITRSELLVENFGTSYWSEIGLPWSDLARVNPKLRIVSLTSFGNDGPYQNLHANDININAVAGIADCIGYPDRNPLNMPFHQALLQQGANGAAAAIFSLFMPWGAEGKPFVVDVAAADVMASQVGTLDLVSATLGIPMKRDGKRAGSAASYPTTILKGKEGPIILVTPGQYEDLLAAMGNPEWSKEPRFRNQLELRKYADEFDQHVEAWLMTLSHQDVERISTEYGIPMYPLRNIDEIIEDQQYRFRNFFKTLRYGAAEYKVPGLPFPQHAERVSGATQTGEPRAVRKPVVIDSLPIGRDNEHVFRGVDL